MKGGSALDRLRVVVGVVLLILYAGATVQSLRGVYEVPTELHALMAIVAGALFGPSFIKRGGETSDR